MATRRSRKQAKIEQLRTQNSGRDGVCGGAGARAAGGLDSGAGDRGEIREALEKAFDYRGDITMTRKDGSKVEGYLFDRRPGPTLADSFVRIIPTGQATKLNIAYSDVAALAFTGRDTAAGKTFEAWVKKYWEKKAAGEKNIQIEPEKLD